MAVLTDDELKTRLDDARSHRADISTLEDRKRAIDAEIINHLFESGDRYLTDEGKYKLVEPEAGSWAIGQKETKTIDKAALVAAGVDPDTIENCTRTTYSDPFIVYYPKREKKEGNGEAKKGKGKKA